MDEIVGLIYGVITAVFASLSYIMSRRFSSRQGQTPHQLMALSHVLMGIASLVILPFVYIDPACDWLDVIFPVCSVVVSYFAAQYMLFAILKRYSASNIAPMLGLKLVVAGIVTTYLGTVLSSAQITALFLAVCATLILRDRKEGITFYAILWVVAICICFSISDFSIAELTERIDPEKSMSGIIMSLVLCYITSAIYPLIFYREVRLASARAWKDASAYAVTWYLCMVFLFTTFATLGVVYTVVLQSMRGIIAVVLGLILARLGYSQIEENVSFGMRIRQLFAAVLIVAAVYLYSGDVL